MEEGREKRRDYVGLGSMIILVCNSILALFYLFIS